MSGVREHQLGKGTLGYKGETAEYYRSKRGLWDVARWVIAAVCIVVGAAFLYAASSPVVQARVVYIVDHGVSGTNGVVLVAPDGASSTVTVSYASTPAIGSTQLAQELPGGRLVIGDQSATGRGAGLLFLALGMGMAAFSFWRMRHPKQRVTTVLVPDDTYALPPH